jgi:GNAT superfamily N-acetyltransferase
MSNWKPPKDQFALHGHHHIEPSATTIVTIVASDPRAAALATVYADSFRAPPWNEEIDVKEQALLWLRHTEINAARYLIAMAGTALVGGAEYMPLDMFPERRNAFPSHIHGSLFLNELFIAPLAQNKGIGSALLKQVEVAAFTQGFSHVSLRTHAADSKLCSFYGHRAYVPVCDVPSMSGGPLRRVFIKDLGV